MCCILGCRDICAFDHGRGVLHVGRDDNGGRDVRGRRGGRQPRALRRVRAHGQGRNARGLDGVPARRVRGGGRHVRALHAPAAARRRGQHGLPRVPRGVRLPLRHADRGDPTVHDEDAVHRHGNQRGPDHLCLIGLPVRLDNDDSTAHLRRRLGRRLVALFLRHLHQRRRPLGQRLQGRLRRLDGDRMGRLAHAPDDVARRRDGHPLAFEPRLARHDQQDAHRRTHGDLRRRDHDLRPAFVRRRHAPDTSLRHRRPDLRRRDFQRERARPQLPAVRARRTRGPVRHGLSDDLLVRRGERRLPDRRRERAVRAGRGRDAGCRF